MFKNTNVSIIPTLIPTISANNPTFKACFHFVTPTEVKYKHKTYIVVSVLPCIVEAILQAIPSTSFLQIESKTATEALPETGLKIIIGIISIKLFISGKIFEISFDISSINPEDFNKVTQKSIAKIEGNTSLKRFNPSLEPFINDEYAFFLLIIENIIIKIIKSGIKINDLLFIQ